MKLFQVLRHSSSYESKVGVHGQKVHQSCHWRLDPVFHSGHTNALGSGKTHSDHSTFDVFSTNCFSVEGLNGSYFLLFSFLGTFGNWNRSNCILVFAWWWC